MFKVKGHKKHFNICDEHLITKLCGKYVTLLGDFITNLKEEIIFYVMQNKIHYTGSSVVAELKTALFVMCKDEY